MNTSKSLPYLRTMALLFDLAIIYLLVFICIISPIILISQEVIKDASVSLGNILFGTCLGLLAIIVTFLYLWLPCVLFKGSTLGMKVFKIKYVSLNHEKLTPVKLLIHIFTMLSCLVLTIGLSPILDICCFWLNKNEPQTFGDGLNFLTVHAY